MKKYFLVILVIVLLLFILISSLKNKSRKVNHYYTITDSIKLKSPSLWISPRKIKNLFIAINQYERRLELYSMSGEILSYCGSYGKGPGELLNPKFLDYYGNIIYLVDRGNNKIVIIELDYKNKQLNYKGEFYSNISVVDVCAIRKDKIFLSVIGDANNIKLYNNNGNLLQEYSIPSKDRLKNDKDIFNSLFFIENCGDNHILLGGIYNMKLYFYYFDYNKNSLIRIHKRNVKYRNEATRDEENVYGLAPIYYANNKYYLSFNPDNKRIKETFFEVYEKQGNYLGNSYLKNTLVYNVVFSSTADTLWFMKPGNDTTIYIARNL